ncbi:response regulator [Salipiger sp. IMCC34102]|uniref:response regulator n=1 Tax=Salipiger sp. IMCC34102 TaxID=2510647 RepID=UPI00101D8341|nr:response regulator [Salipiger sp. IMCC34102]RYH00938.1 response regulator [Salipiger sp. IMCC34102]
MKILAVDDDPFILEVLTSLVELMDGFDLLTAEGVSQALEVMADHGDIECFLVDIQMPERDGISLVRDIRADKRFERAPVLMLTAMADKVYIDRAFAAGATDYINKPFDISELSDQLELEKRRVEERRQQDERLTQTASGHSVSQSSAPFSLYQPFDVHDIDNVVTLTALENYVTRLSRSALFGSSVFGVTLRRAPHLFDGLSEFDFKSLIADIAEAISDQLMSTQSLITYVGGGSFVCVLEDGACLDRERMTDALNLAIHRMDLHDSNGQPLHLRVCAGQPVRLFWRPGHQAIECLSQAHANAESEAQRMEENLDKFWTLGESAT